MNEYWSFDDGPRFMKLGELTHHVGGFARELDSTGYTRLTILGYVMSIAHFATWARTRRLSVKDINEDLVSEFGTHRCRCPGSRQWQRVSRKYARRVRRFVRYLERQGIIVKRESPAARSMPDFRDWLIQHRGASLRTVERYEGSLFKVLPASPRARTHFTAAKVRALVLTEARIRSRPQIRDIVIALRAYLKFLASQGHCRPGLDHAIPQIPQWRLAALPRYLPADDIDRVIASCSRESQVGLRDRAILLLLARLGLRGGDIVKMRIDDVDWCRGTLKVCGKGRREVCLPLPQEAGDAILAYLKAARPKVGIEQLFMSMQAPFRSLSNSGAVSNLVSAALRRAAISKPPSRGANLLRHSAATAMLRGGASLHTVSSVLRHRSTDMTAHYAKVDIVMLQSVVQPWPEGVSC
jgi:integrase/recombinase XerD